MHDPPTDETLVRQALAGSREAFGVLYDRYAGLIRAVAYDRTRDHAAARDLCQDAFLKAYRKLDTLNKPGSFAAWVYGIALNLCRDHQQKILRRSRLRPGADPAALSFTEDHTAGLLQRELLDAVAELPESERVAIHLHYLDEHPVERSCEVLGVSRSGFYALLDRARRRLREQFDPVPGAKP